jgi:hypothetical protein
MGFVGLSSLSLVALEWLALGWLSGLDWPSTAARSNRAWPVRWALRVLVGAVLVATAELLLALVGVGFSSPPLVLAVAALAAVGLRVIVPPASAPPPASVSSVSVASPLDRREAAGWTVLGLVCLAGLVRSLLVPEAGWDAYSHWGLRAQAYSLAGTILNAGSEHEYYPPLVPLLEAWLYRHVGQVDLDLAKTVWGLLGSGFAVCLAWHLRLSLSRAWLAPWLSIGTVLVTPALLEGFLSGQADLALTTFVTLAVLASWQWLRLSDTAWLIQSMVFAFGAALSKLEGSILIGVLLTALLLEAALSRRRQPVQVAALLCLATGLAIGLWTVAAARAEISANSEHLGAFQPGAVLLVLVSLVTVFGGLRTGGGLLVALAAWLLAGRHLLRPFPRLLTLVVAGQAASTVLAFLFSGTSPEIEVRTAATRLVSHWLPLGLVVAVLALDQAERSSRTRTPIIGPGDEDSARRENHGRRRAGTHSRRPGPRTAAS